MSRYFLLGRNIFVFCFTVLTVVGILGYLPSQAGNIVAEQAVETVVDDPFQNILEKLGPELSTRNVFSVPYNTRQVIFIGQTHYLTAFQEFKEWLIQEALAGNLVLILEGLPREASWESKYRLSVNGQGEEPIYGMEEGAALLVEAGVICRYMTLGLIENYGIDCPEHIINLSAFEPLGEKVWNELPLQSVEEETKKLIRELDSFVQLIRIAPDFQAKLAAFDKVRKPLIDMSVTYNKNTWAQLYGAFAAAALPYAQAMPTDLRNMTTQLLQSKATISMVQEWLLYDSVYREQTFAQTVLWVMAHTDSSLPAVVLVGRGHLVGLIKALAEAQTAINNTEK